MFDKSQFTDLFGSVTISKDESVPAASYFLHNGQKFRDLTFRPGESERVMEHGHLAFNVYRPLSVKGADGNVKPWLDLCELVIPDALVRTHYFRYFAHLLQHPGIKINHGLLLTSLGQGVGKDSVFAPVIQLLGDGAGVVTTDDLANDFNDYLYQRLLIVVEELKDFGSSQLANKLKPILARPPDTLRINRKGVPQFDIPNLVHLFMMSNYEQPLRLEPNDRRVHVYRSPVAPKPPEYYETFYRWLNHGLSDVLGFLQRYDLTGFSPYAPPPMTTDKQLLITTSESLIDQHLRAVVEESADLVTLAQIQERLPARLRHTSPHHIARTLRTLGAREVGRIRIESQRLRVWALRNYDEYLSLSESVLKARYSTLLDDWSMKPGSTFRAIAEQDNRAV
jgi:hypothetical protein